MHASIQPKRFKGSYFRAADRTLFTYDVRVDPTVGGSAWFATVRVDGDLRGRTNGVLTHPAFLDPSLEATVRELVEAAIRDRIGVG